MWADVSWGGCQAHSPQSPATTELGHPYPEPWPPLAGSTQALLFPTYSVVCFRLWISSDWPCFQFSFSAPVVRKKFHPFVIYALKDSRRTPWRWKCEIKELIFESPWDPGHRKWISELHWLWRSTCFLTLTRHLAPWWGQVAISGQCAGKDKAWVTCSLQPRTVGLCWPCTFFASLSILLSGTCGPGGGATGRGSFHQTWFSSHGEDQSHPLGRDVQVRWVGDKPWLL